MHISIHSTHENRTKSKLKKLEKQEKKYSEEMFTFLQQREERLSVFANTLATLEGLFIFVFPSSLLRHTEW